MRTAEIIRKTKETDIAVKLNLEGTNRNINTGIGFFDHMLEAFAAHGGFGIDILAVGDLKVDGHHTVEDTGIALGMAFKKAIANGGNIERFGSFYIPMDESLAFASLDISGRPYLAFEADFSEEKVGEMATCLCREFMRAFAFNAGITLHLKVVYGCNAHHEIEALFKALAHALKLAVKENDGEILSTKGIL